LRNTRRSCLNLVALSSLHYGLGFTKIIKKGILSGIENSKAVAPSDIISNLFLEDLEKIWELKKWIPDPCNPYLHYLKQEDKEEK